MLKKKPLLIVSAVVLLGILLSGCSTGKPNGKIKYDHVAMPEETDPYYIIEFADYVFIGSTLSDGTSVTLPNGNKRLEYDISVSECLKGNLAKKIKAVYVNRLMTHSWGQKVIRFYDPDGNLIEVGTPV